MLFTWFTLAGFIFLFAPQKLTDNFQYAFLRVFNWPLSIGENISLSVRTRQPLGDADVVPRREYNKLQNYRANLEGQLRKEHEKVEILSGLRNRFPLEAGDLQLASVFPGSFDKLHGELSIDKGEDDKVAKGQFILSDNSIIGTIGDVSARGAKVKLFTNPTSSIAVEVANTKHLMRGSGDNLARIPMVKHKVEIDSEVMANRMVGFLNAPMIIGKVLRYERNAKSPMLWDIVVEPVCDFEQLNDVAVIVINPPE
jgi:cell shape-determining protein MreC